MSTRPRIEFDSEGRCNACVWADEKKSLDWKSREVELEALIRRHYRRDADFDCLVPVSGGKDGSYVAYTLRERYGLKPLCVTVRPPLERDLGKENLENFIRAGFNHVHLTPNPDDLRLVDIEGFRRLGSAYYGWLTAILSGVLRTAVNYGISLVFYGEDGEVEYGGSTETKYRASYDAEYMRRIYLEGGYDQVFSAVSEKLSTRYFLSFPNVEAIRSIGLEVTHWSYFEPWDPYRNFLVAQEHLNLATSEGSNSGTFTNFAQNDQALYALHTYLMYLKFGFGRANQDASIEIRRGAMSRDQAKALVSLYDGQFPDEFVQEYLDYYRLSQSEFDAVLDRWANRELFEKRDGRWHPLFEIR